MGGTWNRGEMHTIFGGKRPLGRPRHRWEENITMYLKETGWNVVEWILLTQDGD
jgi:hypothetical protein